VVHRCRLTANGGDLQNSNVLARKTRFVRLATRRNGLAVRLITPPGHGPAPLLLTIETAKANNLETLCYIEHVPDAYCPRLNTLEKLEQFAAWKYGNWSLV